jgi:hypothetical protein
MPCTSFCGCGTQGSPTATSGRPTCFARLESAAALAGLRRPTGATCAPHPTAPAVESSPAGGRSERPSQRALTPPSKRCGIRCLAATTAGRWLGVGSQPPRRRRGRPYLLMLLSCCLGCWVRVAGEQDRDRPVLKSGGSGLPSNAERVPRTWPQGTWSARRWRRATTRNCNTRAAPATSTSSAPSSAANSNATPSGSVPLAIRNRTRAR